MTAYNIVRNRVKPGREEDFEQAIRNLARDYAGMRKFTAIKTGDRAYCMIGEWDSMDAIVAARPQMIKSLDSFRDLLEDLGGGLGVTDAVSGEAVVELAARK
ncbi:MAG: antibiotic biosynthesis monooxygenase [Polyangiales bacterium]